jgi:hypothetical protein
MNLLHKTEELSRFENSKNRNIFQQFLIERRVENK